MRPLKVGDHFAVHGGQPGPDGPFKTCPLDPTRGEFVPWVRAENVSNVWGQASPAGAPFAPLLGVYPTEAACRAACEADTNCTQYSWNEALAGWERHCFARCDTEWSLHPLAGVVAARRVNAK